MSKKYSEVEELRGMRSRLAAEIEDLEKVNLDINTMRVNTYQSLVTEREELLSRIYRIDERIKLLGMDGPAQVRTSTK